MDRISKAVERARQERNGLAQRENREKKQKGMSDVSYTKTRSVTLSKELLAKNRIITEEGNDNYTQAYKVLRTRLWHAIKDNGWNSIAVTSCNAGEGKSLTSINLAFSLAMMKANHSVLLVDLDLRRPSIFRYLNLDLEYGISDYLTNGVPLDKILVNPGVERFVILPGNKVVHNSSEILSSARMEHLVHDFKTRYPSRIVIFDLPPLLTTDDAMMFLPYIDAVLLVVEEGKTKTNELNQAYSMLGRTNIAGTILNKSGVSSATKY